MKLGALNYTSIVRSVHSVSYNRSIQSREGDESAILTRPRLDPLHSPTVAGIKLLTTIRNVLWLYNGKERLLKEQRRPIIVPFLGKCHTDEH